MARYYLKTYPRRYYTTRYTDIEEDVIKFCTPEFDNYILKVLFAEVPTDLILMKFLQT